MGKEYSFHRITSASLFLFGDIALYIPLKNAKDGNFSALLLAMAVGTALYFLWYFLTDKIITKLKTKYIKTALSVLIILTSLAICTISIRNLGEYMSAAVLIKNTKFEIYCVFTVVAVLISLSPDTALAKYSFVTFFICIISILILFLSSFDNFRKINSETLFVGKVSSIAVQALHYLVRAFLFPLVFAVFSRLCFKDKRVKNDFSGLVIGSVMIIICYLSSVLTFSLYGASKMDFAYPMSISVVTTGNLLTRMDGFAYFIFFFSNIVKVAVCTHTARILLKKMNIGKEKAVISCLVILSSAVAYII